MRVMRMCSSSTTDNFQREAFSEEKEALAALSDPGKVSNASRRYLLDIAKSANDTSAMVRKAWAGYRSPIDTASPTSACVAWRR